MGKNEEDRENGNRMLVESNGRWRNAWEKKGQGKEVIRETRRESVEKQMRENESEMKIEAVSEKRKLMVIKEERVRRDRRKEKEIERKKRDC